MKRSRRFSEGLKSALSVGLLLGAVAPARGADDPGPLPGFELLQYAATTRLSPASIMSLDNNGELLLACREPQSIAELRGRGFQVTESQLELLRLMQLVRLDPTGRWQVAFPVLGPDETERLRETARELADRALADLRSEIDRLRAVLEERGLEDHAYVVFFSYVLDGMAWGFFEEYGRVPQRRLSSGRPFWAGEVWALDEGTTARMTTSSIARQGVTLRVLMTPALDGLVMPLLAQQDKLRTALAEYAISGRVADPEALALLGRHGLVDAEGAMLVPVVDEVGRDDLFLAAEELTSGLVDWILAGIDLKSQRQAFGFRDEPQTLVVIYHELILELMAALETAGAVERPVPLAEPAEADARDVAHLAVLVDRAERSVPDRDAATGSAEPRRDEESGGGA